MCARQCELQMSVPVFLSKTYPQSVEELKIFDGSNHYYLMITVDSSSVTESCLYLEILRVDA